MRIIYKIVGLLLVVNTTLNAQNQSRTYNEEFNTNKDVVIDVNTRNTEVKIETWNKNKVSVEAIIEIEGVAEDRAERTLNNWKFNAIGNKSEVEITSKSVGISNEFLTSNNVNSIIINGNAEQRFDFDLPVVDVDNIIELNNDIMVFAESPELPVLFDFDFHLEDALPKFDYEKYKSDKDYLKKWQKEMEKSLEKNKLNWEKEAKKVEEHKAVLKEELEKRKEELEKRKEERLKLLEERNKSLEAARKISKDQIAQLKKNAELRKSHIIINGVNRSNIDEKRDIIIGVLEDREKVKVKRTIIIRAPKEAKFKMNVKYGTLSFLN